LILLTLNCNSTNATELHTCNFKSFIVIFLICVNWNYHVGKMHFNCKRGNRLLKKAGMILPFLFPIFFFILSSPLLLLFFSILPLFMLLLPAAYFQPPPLLFPLGLRGVTITKKLKICHLLTACHGFSCFNFLYILLFIDFLRVVFYQTMFLSVFMHKLN
jgi:hypothetical protein